MSYKTLTAMHEIRLCIVQIGLPVALGLIYLHENPEIVQGIKKGCKKALKKVAHPFRKDTQKQKDGSYTGEIL